MSAPIPEALHRWFRSAYPTVSFQPDWLLACVDYLLENEPTLNGSVPGLIKAVEVQLLSSDLATSVIPPSTLPAFDSKPDPRIKKQILFASVPPTSGASQVAKKKAGVLVQVVETDDVAHAALQLTDILTEKREARKVAAKGGGTNGGGRIMDLDDQNDGDAAAEDLDAEAKKKALPAGVEPSYPRGSGKFVLSDGGDVRWTAFELQRINGLGLEEIQLGTKLLLHDVPCINGVLMLTPANTTVKGYQVEELHSIKEWYLEDTFRHRLGLDPLPDPREEVANDAAAGPADPANGAPAAGRGPEENPRQVGKKEEDPDDYFGDEDDNDFDQLDAGVLERRAAPGRAQSDEDEEDALREMMMQDEKMPPQRAPSRTEPGSRSGPSRPGGPPASLQPKKERSTPQGVLASSSTVRSSGNKVEVLDLDSAEDDEPVRPARKQMKEEKTAAVPPRRPARTVIEIDSD